MMEVCLTASMAVFFYRVCVCVCVCMLRGNSIIPHPLIYICYFVSLHRLATDVYLFTNCNLTVQCKLPLT